MGGIVCEESWSDREEKANDWKWIKKLPKKGSFEEVVMVLVDSAPFVFHVDKMPVIALIGFIHRFI